MTVSLPAIKRGTSFVAEITVKDGGVALPLTGWTVKSAIRAKDTDRKLGGVVITVTDVTAGRVRVECLDSRSWDIGTLLWDVLLIDPAGVRRSTPTVEFECEEDVAE